MNRTITAMFDDRAHADAAVLQLAQELGMSRDGIRVYAADTATATNTTATAGEDRGFWGSLKDLFVPEEDRTAYAEGVRRGSVVVSAQVDEGMIDRAMDVLESNGAVDLDHREAEWRQTGWTGAETAASSDATVASSTTSTGLGVAATGAGVAAAATTGGMAGAPASTARAGAEEVIPIVEEQIRVGKRDAERGRVRVRSYIVETPVTEQVTLREEHVDVQRRSVDRPLTDADEAFRERVIDATEHAEEAVVAKEARVKEEMVIRKEATERTETVRDTVRHTEVEVDDTTQGTASTAAGGTGLTGTTPGNPPGTMASRAVDETLGTNISGANPARR